MRAVMDRVRLGGHALSVAPEPPTLEPGIDAAPWASVTPSLYPMSTVQVDATLLNEAPELVEQKLLHEILHMFHGDLITAVIEQVADETDRDRVQKVLVRGLEHMVDQLSRVFQDGLDLPPITPVHAAPGLAAVRER